jgi:hypothetical protein
MIISRTSQSTGVLDGLSIFGELHELQGSRTQTYYASSGTYESDRRYVPLVLHGTFSVADPDGIMSGILRPEDLHSIEWYDDVPVPGDTSTHRISNPGVVPTDPAQYREIDYLISDGSDAAWCKDVPIWGLIVHKNVPYLTGQQIYAIVKFTDTRTGTIVSKQCSFSLATDYLDDARLQIKGTRGAEWVMDPLHFPEPATSGGSILNEAWQRTVGAQLTLKNGNVADAEACYLWVVRDATTGGWREFNSAETGTLLVSGVQTRELTLDVRYVNESLHLRCYGGTRESGAAWATPFASGNPFYEVHLAVSKNEQLRAHIEQKKGFTQDFDLTKPARYELSLNYGNRTVGADKMGLFSVTWRATDLTTFATQTLGTGSYVEFTPSQKGFTAPNGYAVYAEVNTFLYRSLAGSNVFSSVAPLRTPSVVTTLAIDALTIWGDIFVVQGQTNQFYNDATGTYEADRRYAPLILNGMFNVVDPMGKMTGTPPIYGIEWYDDVPGKLSDGSDDTVTHRISNPGTIPDDPAQYRLIDYLISDGSDAAWCQGVPKGALIIHKNIPHMTAQSVYAVIKFVDTRTGNIIRKQCSMSLTCGYSSANTLIVKGTRGTEWIMDPITFPEPLTAGHDITEEPWERTIGAQLHFSDNEVADAEACYLWVVRDATTGGWREFDDVEKAVLLRSEPTAKNLLMDMRFIKKSMHVRCYGRMRESGAAWVSPFAAGMPFYECHIAVSMNEELKVRIAQQSGFALEPALDNTCAYSLALRYGNRIVPANKLGLFRIVWKGTDNKTFAEQVLGNGTSISFRPIDKGFSFPDGFGVKAEVYTLSCMSLVTSGPAYVTSNNALVISGVYE